MCSLAYFLEEKIVLHSSHCQACPNALKSWLIFSTCFLLCWVFIVPPGSKRQIQYCTLYKLFKCRGVCFFLFMVPANMEAHGILGWCSFSTIRTSVGHRSVMEMLGLKMTKDTVSAGSSKLTESAGKQLPFWIFYDVRIDYVFPCSGGVCKRLQIEQKILQFKTVKICQEYERKCFSPVFPWSAPPCTGYPASSYW